MTTRAERPSRGTGPSRPGAARPAFVLVLALALLAASLLASVALGNLAPSDFIAVVVPLAALLGVVAVGRGSDDPPRRPAKPHDQPSQILTHLPTVPSAEPLVPDGARTGDRPD